MWIDASTLLAARDLKPRLVDGERRQHRIPQLAEIARTVKLLSHLWVEVDDVPVRRDNQRIRHKGRVREPLLLFYDFQAQWHSPTTLVPDAWLYNPGRWIEPFCGTQRYPLGWVSPELLRYDPARRPWAKRLGYYMSFLLSRTGEAAPITIQDLLRGAGLGHPRRARTKGFQRRALAAALTQLKEAKIITKVQEVPPTQSTDDWDPG